MTAVSVPIELPPKTCDLAQLVADHQATVWRYVRYLGATAAEADDLVQETFVAVWRSDFTHSCPQQTAGYLRTTARHRLLMLRRRQKCEPSHVELELADQVWSETFAEGPVDPYLDALDRCLDQLEGRARLALDFHYTEHLTRAQIAESLKMKPGGVKSLLRRTRDILRNCIERKIEVPSPRP
jgi:RNA polymerase sigma-70 factor (ECF subfamily)